MIFKDVNNMETKLNIAEILKDKPQGTKLYDLLCNMSVKLNTISTTETIVWCSNKTDNKTTRLCCYSEFGTVRGCPDGLQILKPSKSMRDWSKFTWKRGDVLINDAGYKVFFDKWENDDYTKFFGSVKVHCYDTEDYTLASKEEAQEFIKSTEKAYGGKLNLETLEIEKQPEFKDGDVLCVIDNSDDYHYTLIYKGQDNEHIYRYVTMFEDNSLHIRKDAHLTKPKDYSIRYATKEEKQELFDSLAKEGKAWDAEKKQVVDLKPKVRFKSFDKVVAYCEITNEWSCDIFSHYAKNYEDKEVITCLGGGTYYKALPYNEETAKLLGTTKDVEG